MLDLLINNARVVDGTGMPAKVADIGIADGRIVTIGKIDAPARQHVDAEGRVAAPGFIDIHTHYDAQVFWDGTLSPSSYHGVTSIFGGNCGFSIAPLTKEAAPYLLRMLARVEGMPESSLKAGVPWDWTSFADYLGRIEGKIGLNAGFLAGHSAIRRVVMGGRAVGSRATPDDLEKMKRLLAQSLGEGAIGFSSSITTSHNDGEGEPVPSRHADREEIIALAGVCRDYEGTSLGFIPDVAMFSDYEKALMTDMSLAAQRPLNWNLLAVQPDSEAFIAAQLSASDYARQRGARVIALTPAQPSILRINLRAGFIFDMLEGWSEIFKLGIPERIALLKDPAKRQELDRRGKSRSGPFRRVANWETLIVSNTKFKQHEGKTVGALAQESGKTPFDALCELAIAEDLNTTFTVPPTGVDERSWARRGELWRDPRCLISASDAGAHLDMLESFNFTTRLLEEGVRRRKLLSLEEAVHRLTQVPARLYGLRERGVIKEGWHADIVVFDPDTVGSGPVYTRQDLPGGEMRLYADALGIDHVIVNGVPVVESRVHTGNLPGTVLRSGRDTFTPLL